MYPIFPITVLLPVVKMYGAIFVSRAKPRGPKNDQNALNFAKIRVWGYFGYFIPGYSSIKYPKCGYTCLYGYSIQLLSD